MQVGDIIMVKNNQEFPSDMILISSSTQEDQHRDNESNDSCAALESLQDEGAN